MQMDKDIKDTLPVYFLGICHKFREPAIAKTADGGVITRQDIIGLKTFHIQSIYPIIANEFFAILLIDNYQTESLKGTKLTIRHEDNSEVGFIEINEISTFGQGTRVPTRHTLIGIRIPGILKSPGVYSVFFREDLLGRFVMQYVPSLPMTDELLQAIKSDPLAYKHLKMELRCTECNDKMLIGAGIDKEGFTESEIWYQDLPDYFKCKCGKTHMPLKYLRDNLHSALGYKESVFTDSANTERMYSFSALEEIYRAFKDLLDNAETSEEQIQKFIEHNQIVLNFFNPKLLKFKATATTKYITDFAILNQRDELVLIEIERANLRLFKKDGGQHSELTQSINQVENWLIEASKDRYGFISSLNMIGISIDKITSIKTIVIAGRTKTEDPNNLEKLYSRTGYSFYTYDDILKYLRQTIDKIKEL